MGLNDCHRLALPPTALIPGTCAQIREKSLSSEGVLTPSSSGRFSGSSWSQGLPGRGHPGLDQLQQWQGWHLHPPVPAGGVLQPFLASTAWPGTAPCQRFLGMWQGTKGGAFPGCGCTEGGRSGSLLCRGGKEWSSLPWGKLWAEEIIPFSSLHPSPSVPSFPGSRARPACEMFPGKCQIRKSITRLCFEPSWPGLAPARSCFLGQFWEPPPLILVYIQLGAAHAAAGALWHLK